MDEERAEEEVETCAEESVPFLCDAPDLVDEERTEEEVEASDEE